MIANKFTKNLYFYNKGFSILELIIFVGIFSVLIVSALGFTLRMSFAMKHNLHRQMAARYVEEAREWLNGEREAGWEGLEGRATVAGTEYCLNDGLNLDTDISTIPTSNSRGGCNNTGIGGRQPMIYRRTLVLTKDSVATATTVGAVITVSWNDEGTPFSETVETAYSVWQ